MENQTGPILFFDGVCGLCSRAVDFLIQRDPHGRLQFCPLQSQTAQRKLGSRASDLDTVYLWIPGPGEGELYQRSTAMLKALILIGSSWSPLARLALLIPRVLRDAVYRLIAANRFRILPKAETCRMPTPEERQRFIVDKEN